MRLQYYFRNQRELAKALQSIIDDYWDKSRGEEDMRQELTAIIEGNRDIMYLDNTVRSIVQQRLGKRRLNLIEKVMSKVEENN